MVGSAKTFPSLHEISREEGRIHFAGNPREWIGTLIGYAIAAVIAGGFVRSLAGNPGGWSLLFPLGGLAFIAAWAVGWTRQQFFRYEVRVDRPDRSARFSITPFLGKTSTRVVRAGEVEAVRVTGMNPSKLELGLRGSGAVYVDSSTDPKSLQGLAQELARTLEAPLRDTAP